MNIGGFFSFKKYDENNNLVEEINSSNVIVDQFVELIESKMFKQNFVSGYLDTRKINKFIVGYSDEQENPKTVFSSMYDTANRTTIRQINDTEDTVNNFISDIDNNTWETNYAQTKRIMKLTFASPSGQHVGNWRELGLVMTGLSGESPLLFCRTTGFDFFKNNNEVVIGEYNIVF
jgi:predicted lactoylglutathione lyase